MSDPYLSTLLGVTSTPYLAQYLPTSPPLDGVPANCTLPTPTTIADAPTTLPTLPSKACTPNFTPFPIIPAPFSLPENCPNGISFNVTDVGIYSSLSATNPAALWPISASQVGNACTFALSIPDIVIPCYPTGPTVTGEASIIVYDPNTGTTTTSTIGMSNSQSCAFNLSGNVNINLPQIPCPSGISFSSGTLEIWDSPTSGAVSSSVASISTSTNSCTFELDLPPIIIPCYSTGGYGVSLGNVTINDPLTPDTQTTLNPTTTGTACNPIINIPPINIPCFETGTVVTVADMVIKDPNNTDSSYNQTLPVRIGGTACNPIINLPILNIPCNGEGIGFPDNIQFNLGTGADAIAVKVVTGGTNCNWTIPPINLPISCPSGLSTSAASTLTVVNTNAPDPITGKYPPASGLAYPAAATGLQISDCNLSYSNPTLNLPLMPCNFQANPVSSVTFSDGNGNVPAGCNLTFGDSNICNLNLQGTITLTGGSGSGVAPWNPYSTTNAGLVAAPCSDGGMGLYQPVNNPGPNDIPGASSKYNPLSIPHIGPYQVIKSNLPIPGYTVSPGDETVSTTQLDAIVKVVPTSYLYKNEFSDANTNRLPVFGLDMPFVLMPGETVFLEVVYCYINSILTPLYGAICKAATSTDGSSEGDSSIINGSTVVVNATPNNYKAFTASDLTTAGLTGPGTGVLAIPPLLQTYITTSVDKYIGISNESPEYDAFCNIQALALLSLYSLASASGSSTSIPWQFKSWAIIAESTDAADNAAPASGSTNQVVPANTGLCALSVINTINGTIQKYQVRQVIDRHQALSYRSTGVSASAPIAILANDDCGNISPFLYNADIGDETGDWVQPTCTIKATLPPRATGASTLTQTLSITVSDFELGDNILSYYNSALISAMLTTLAGLKTTYNSIAITYPSLTSAATELSIGTGLLDIKVYYTLDGSMPSIDTQVATGTHRYEMSSNDLTGVPLTVTNTITSYTGYRVAWMAVYPEYLKSNPACVPLTISTSGSSPNVTYSYSWGTPLNGEINAL